MSIRHPKSGTDQRSRSAANARFRKEQERQRKRLGRALLTLEVTMAELSDALVEGGWLPQWDSEDQKAVAAALANVVEAVTRDQGELLRLLKQMPENEPAEGNTE
jgi:hypothetical protein